MLEAFDEATAATELGGGIGVFVALDVTKVELDVALSVGPTLLTPEETGLEDWRAPLLALPELEMADEGLLDDERGGKLHAEGEIVTVTKAVVVVTAADRVVTVPDLQGLLERRPGPLLGLTYTAD